MSSDPVVATNVKSSIEPQQKLFIPVLFGSDEFQKTSIPKAVQSFFKTGEPSYSFAIKTHVREDSLLIVEDT